MDYLWFAIMAIFTAVVIFGKDESKKDKKKKSGNFASQGRSMERRSYEYLSRPDGGYGLPGYGRKRY